MFRFLKHLNSLDKFEAASQSSEEIERGNSVIDSLVNLNLIEDVSVETMDEFDQEESEGEYRTLTEADIDFVGETDTNKVFESVV